MTHLTTHHSPAVVTSCGFEGSAKHWSYPYVCCTCKRVLRAGGRPELACL